GGKRGGGGEGGGTEPGGREALRQLVPRGVELHRLRVQNDRLLEDLRRANVFLAAAIDEIPVGALVVDAAGIVRAANRPGREYLGLDADPSGRGLDEVLDTERLRPVRDVPRRLAGAEPTPYEELRLAASGVS